MVSNRAEEYERSVGCNAPDKCIPSGSTKLGMADQESTGCAAQPADVFAATRKVQRTTAEAGGERNLRATGVTLINITLGKRVSSKATGRPGARSYAGTSGRKTRTARP